MDRKDNQYPQGETARILVEFLEVAITSIVFLKGIYPPGDFERRKYVNLVVHSARHPELRDYIHSAVSGLHPFIQKILRPDDEKSCYFHFAGHVWLVKLCGKEVFNSSTSRGFDVKKPVVVPSKRSSEHVVVPSKYYSYEKQM